MKGRITSKDGIERVICFDVQCVECGEGVGDSDADSELEVFNQGWIGTFAECRKQLRECGFRRRGAGWVCPNCADGRDRDWTDTNNMVRSIELNNKRKAAHHD